MRITTVVSTTLATIAYDGARHVLQREFRSRTVYQYLGVPATVHEALLCAPSKGSYFNQAIRGRFRFTRLLEPRAEVPSAEVQSGHQGSGEAPCHAR